MGVNKEANHNLWGSSGMRPRPMVRLCFHGGPWDGAELPASQNAARTIAEAGTVYAHLDTLPIGLENEVVWSPTASLVTISKAPGQYQAPYHLKAIEARALHFVWGPAA